MKKDLFIDSDLDDFDQEEDVFELASSSKKKRDLEARRKIEALKELKRLRELSGDPTVDWDWLEY
jgi:hypothetical protein